MKLWHLHSDVLDGFYQSDVFAAGETQTDAIEVALLAYDRWVQKTTDDLGFHPVTRDDFDDPSFEARNLWVRQDFHRELKEKLRWVRGRSLICVHNG